MPRKPKPIAEQLRAAIAKAEKRGVTRYQIAQASGVAQSTLSQFVHGKGHLRIESAERVAEAIGKRLMLTEQG